MYYGYTGILVTLELPVEAKPVAVSRYMCDTGANVGAPGRRSFFVKWRTSGMYPHTLGKGKRGKL